MSGIVCAVRGGPESQTTVERAVDLAVETRLNLFFLYIVNLDFLSRTASSRVQTISDEMKTMGEFILSSAVSEAELRGVQAEGEVRHGSVQEEIVKFCHEVQASYLVLGRPKLQHEESFFTHEQLLAFVEKTEEQTGAKVVLPEGSDG